MFLLVPAYPGSPAQTAVKWLLLLLTVHVLPWTKEVKYLGIFIVQSRAFKCAIDDAKCSFYRAANAIFGEVGRQLIKSECIPVLLYGLVACPLNKSQLSSLDFAMNRFLLKLFSTSHMEMGT